MVKKCQYDAENVVVTFFGRFSAKEDFPNFREDGLAQGYKKESIYYSFSQYIDMESSGEH